jgi:hypothetical protein
MIVAACCIRLPCLHQDIPGDVACAIENPPLNDDTLAGDIRAGDIAAEIILEYFEAGLTWN